MEQAPRALNAASHTLLAIVYILPLFYAMPPNANVILTSTLAVFTGCLRTIAPGRDDVERLSQKEAMRFPLMGSVSLLSLFLAIKFLPKGWVNIVIGIYFCGMGVLAVGEVCYTAVRAAVARVAGPALADRRVVDVKQLTIPYLMPDPEDISLTVASAISGCLGLAFTLWYATTKHYLSNNGLGLAYSLTGISMLNLGSTQIGMLLLCGLFFYDIFWVFATPVMVAVARGIDGPIKLLFPRPPVDGLTQFGMLGLGDIVIPGIFVALMLHFDISNHTATSGTPFPYFYSAMGGYVAGMCATIYVMTAFNAAQPALLYIVPAVIGAVFACALVRGEVRMLWSYSEVEEGPEGEAGDTGDADKGAAGGGEKKGAGVEGSGTPGAPYMMVDSDDEAVPQEAKKAL